MSHEKSAKRQVCDDCRITARTALRLGTLFGTTAEFWMGLQADWELWHAQRDEKKLRSAS